MSTPEGQAVSLLVYVTGTPGEVEMRAHPVQYESRQESRQSGVSAVEFALVLPIFLMLVLGIIDFGGYFFVRLGMINAAREGARVGVTQCKADLIGQQYAQSYLKGAGLSFLADSDHVPLPTHPKDASDELAVTVNATVTDDLKWLPQFFLAWLPPTITAKAIMRWEQTVNDCP